jgi:hypothetical protein
MAGIIIVMKIIAQRRGKKQINSWTGKVANVTISS